ncbi:uncharacterized protein LOC122500469 [Leptopilina heterotoma]|uniref:uncharacterized protein LOC122500469 n=1 Tax=Leptopilina heterotoma TaxID=63436 RepID=UPI001CA987C6|nr:uncharacterized protein LOC122500469 [Leptopilina heterotoma]
MDTTNLNKDRSNNAEQAGIAEPPSGNLNAGAGTTLGAGVGTTGDQTSQQVDRVQQHLGNLALDGKGLSGAAVRRRRRERARDSLRTESHTAGSSQNTSGVGGRASGSGSRKRRQDSEEASPSNRMPPKKIRGPQGGTLSFAEITRSSLAGAIVAEGYPRVQMTLANLDQLRVAIHEEIGGDEVGPYPHFGEVHLTRGAILVECLDSESREWLNSRIPRFSQALEGLAIKVVDPAELIKLVRVVAWVPGPRVNQASILKNLGRQNTGVDTSAWRVYSGGEGRADQASAVGWTLALGVPKSDIEALQARQLKLCFGLGQITLRVARQGTDTAAGQGTQ